MKKSRLLLQVVSLTLCLISGVGAVANKKSKDVVGKANNREVLDKIVARVNGQNLLLSSLVEPRLDKAGAVYTLEELIDNAVLMQKAAERKLLLTDLEMEKQIALWKEMRGLSNVSEREFESRLKHDGLTGRQFRNQLARITAIKRLWQFEVSERVVITAREVEEFFKNNPEYTEDRYKVQTKIVPLSDAATAEEAKGKASRFDWIDSDWIEHSRLADKVAFVAKMQEGEEAEPVNMGQGYQFIKLVKKEVGHLKTISERWTEIEQILQEKKKDKLEKEFIKELRDKALIVYLD